MDPITMMVASVGMQFFNNYANNEKNKEIQAQQREFQKAAQIHDFERMRKAQSEAARLSLELEEEVHNERIKDIEDSYDVWLKNLAHSFTINNWPLNVLPFVMKGESFGSLFSGTSKSINMHCILTPSNCEWFNQYFYDDLDLRIEAEMNNNWNSQTTHPIVYYGGAWNRRKRNTPTGPIIPENINLVDIALLENQLKQFPTMVITPYFDPYLHFRVKLWGMGKNSNIPFRIDIPYGDIEPSKRIFSHDYSKDNKLEDTDDLFNTTMEEMVPYISNLIGFVADKYFWSMYHVAPLLPLVFKKQHYTIGIQDTIKEYYVSEFVDYTQKVSFGVFDSMNFLESTKDFVRKDNFLKMLDSQVTAMRSQSEIQVSDIRKILECSELFDTRKYDRVLDELCKQQVEELEIREGLGTSYDDICSFVENTSKEALLPRYFVLCVWNPDVIIGTFCDDGFRECIFHKANNIRFFVLVNNKLNRDNIKSLDVKFYYIDLLNNFEINTFIMEKKARPSFKERLGHRLVANGMRLLEEEQERVANLKNDDPWGDKPKQTPHVDEIENIVSYFIKGVNNQEIKFERIDDDMSMKRVLDWLDSLMDSSVIGKNQVYVVKGKYVEKNKILYCSFLAYNDHFNIEDSEKCCFICDWESNEMRQLFNGKAIYVIPFED